jgi:LytS/YehU family sensor histidine kinase
MPGPGFNNAILISGVVADRDSIRIKGFFNRRGGTNDTLDRIMPPFPLREPGLFGVPKGVWLITLNNAVSSFALLLLIGGFIRLAYSFIRNQNEKKVLENANLNAEVNFLKSQINPHFLFNTLNSIYSQAHSRSDRTEFSILKLSELLRYVLYDSGESKVELDKDIQYINNYIDLQKIRLSSKVRIHYEVTGDLKGCMIAPLLLITFIENAFKHGISYTHASSVNIEINVFEETLTLLVGNPVVERNSCAVGGLGLKNVTRRLDLLYPGKYLLDIHHDDYVHVVNLKLNLKND